MAFTLRQLRYFASAARRGGVSRAAQELCISQSAVTEAIKELEADLGVTLFDRHPRGLALTFQGNQFLRHADKILSEVSVARQSFERDMQVQEGHLHLGVTSLMAGYVLSDVLARFKRVCPGVEVSVTEDSTEYLEHLLIGGELDVAVMIDGARRERTALNTEVLSVSPFRLWMPSGHRFLSQESVSLNEVTTEPLIMLQVDEMEAAAVNLLSALGRRPQVAFRTRSVEAVRSMVATGAGLALLPDLVYRPWSLDGDRIESRDVSGALPVVNVAVVWRKGAPLPSPALDFVDIAKESPLI
ncbi:LysR family transcriptional regulator [Pseudaestuariivita rosea]|uniref:LysR family transcriptional regulator n=1 Tax=Pseudaestuariivita rosea TaxID=2763263 RepID=UPI001ABBACD3|nr:LysR family transcriptional regulator [Pseudaestuariivita rosea]